ncbi:MAG: hypothetical protein A3F40_02555 [Chlamydiae bacterium RIFCSPHIGHO2_12_FULL_27_8]|nr:MAG: hypothetical protein A3F40_02555 [Chlamydiae bacterium RIFCSPHIGHO2_12_FULL_27_8]
MNFFKILTSALHLIVVLIFLVISSILIFAGLNHQFLIKIWNFLYLNEDIVLKIGCLFLLGSVFLFICFYLLYKKQYLQIKMNQHISEVDPKIMNFYILQNLNKTFSDKKFYSKTKYFNNKLEVELYLKKNDQNPDFYLEIEKNISGTLFKYFNFKNEFNLFFKF